MILHIEPVTNIKAFAIYRKGLIVQTIRNHKRYKFFREMKWAVIIRTTTDSDRQSVSSVIGLNKKISPRFR